MARTASELMKLRTQGWVLGYVDEVASKWGVCDPEIADVKGGGDGE